MRSIAMQAADLYVLQTAQSWLDAGQAAVLLTVARTWGSSPRPPGAMMAIRADGAVRGIAALCPGARPALATYGVDGEQARRFGL
ncbi:XdhC family protein, partial [Bordetella pertussis]|uniref:XdhC family protein n=1 Tax=Bordetella pertussis TaxID=520 RepID=UPI0018A6B28B